MLLSNAAYAWFRRTSLCGAKEAKEILHHAICGTVSEIPDDVCVTEHYLSHTYYASSSHITRCWISCSMTSSLGEHKI
jgi:hypothetical protein